MVEVTGGSLGTNKEEDTDRESTQMGDRGRRGEGAGETDMEEDEEGDAEEMMIGVVLPGTGGSDGGVGGEVTDTTGEAGITTTSEAK